MRSRLVHASLIVAVVTGCAEDATPVHPAAMPLERGDDVGTPWFRDVADRSGIEFVHASDAGARARRFPEIMGGGVALFDLENDGDLDLYFVQSGDLGPSVAADSAGNALFENDGAGNFEDISLESGAADRGYGMGVAAGDVDNDGLTDLYVTNVGPNTLLRNRGARTFEDTTQIAGVGARSWSTSAAMVDVDQDGDLDLFVCNYVDWAPERELACATASGRPDYCSPKSYNAALADTLYVNGGRGIFTDESASAGLLARRGNGLGVVCGDFDGDERVDIFVANDQMENHLWHNNGDGTFTDIAIGAGCAVDQHGEPKAGMGALAEDIDDDGDLDLLVVNLRAQADSFFRNEGVYFTDETARVGLGNESRPYTRFGVGWIDFDNDGWLDLYQANGRVVMVSERSSRSDDPYAEPNMLFAGRSTGRYEAVLPQGGVAGEAVHTSRGAAFGDIDNDGGVDVVVVNRDAAPYVLRNVVTGRGHWVRFRVLTDEGRDAIGAELRIEFGGRIVRRDVKSAYSYCAANDVRVHVGLGDVTEVSHVSLRWPDGHEESFGPFEVDRDITLRSSPRDGG